MNKKLVTLFPEPCNDIRCNLSSHPNMREWVTIINEALLKHKSQLEIVEWFSTTDNFVLEVPTSNHYNIANIFESCTKIKCVCLPLPILHLIINEIISIANYENISGVNWGAGVGLQLEGARHYFDDFHTNLISVSCVQPGVAAIIRKQYIAKHHPPQKLEQRIEWIKVCKILNKKIGEKWITRNVQSLEGIFQRALQHHDRN